MKFEHLVEINDSGNPSHPRLTREELWLGLLCRAEDACAFLPGLESCRILERAPARLLRELDFGTSVVRDLVTFETLQWICFEVEASARHVGGRLTIHIEEPSAGDLFLRFCYHTTLSEDAGSENVRYADYVRAAYHQSDLDTVRVIRRIVAENSVRH